MNIYMELDYVTGRIGDAHLEGFICFSKEEQEDFQILLKKEDSNEEELTDEEINRLNKYKEKILGNCEFIIDWYDIEDYGGYHWEDCID